MRLRDRPPYLPREVIQRLADGAVDFVVIGGVAVTLHGSALFTNDTDVMYWRDLENVRRLADVLADFDITLKDIDEDVPFTPDYRALWLGVNFTLLSKFGELDLLGEISGVDSYDGLKSRAVNMRIADRDVLVASIDDLIAMKTVANRIKDQRAILDLVEIKKLLDEKR